MDPLQTLASAGRRLIVYDLAVDGTPVRMVFGCRRPSAARMLTLMQGELVAARQRVEDASTREMHLRLARTEEGRQAAAEALDRRAQDEAETRTRQLSDPAELLAMYGELDALIMETVVAVGFAAEGVEPGAQPSSARPDTVCTQIPDTSPPLYLRPVRWLPAGSVSDEGLPIDHLSEVDRARLAMLVVQAFVPVGEVDTFRREPGGAGARGPVGEAVQPPTLGAAAGRAGRG
jgi:hypothetical protein